MRAPGAMPDALPKPWPSMVTSTPWLPAAVDGGVRAVAAAVARRQVLRVGEGVAGQDALVVVAGGDDLAVAGGLAPPLTGLADAAEAGHAADVRAVGGERRVLRPDAGVQHPDDDVLAGLGGTAVLVPDAVRTGQAEELRRVHGVGVDQLVALHGQHRRVLAQGDHLRRRQVGGEPVQRGGVAVGHVGVAGRGQHPVLLRAQPGFVLPGVGRAGVVLHPLAGRGGLAVQDDHVRAGPGRRCRGRPEGLGDGGGVAVGPGRGSGGGGGDGRGGRDEGDAAGEDGKASRPGADEMWTQQCSSGGGG